METLVHVITSIDEIGGIDVFYWQSNIVIDKMAMENKFKALTLITLELVEKDTSIVCNDVNAPHIG